MMLGYLSFLLPVLAQAAPWSLQSGQPTAHGRLPLTLRGTNDSSTNSQTAFPAGTPTPSASASPCKDVSLVLQGLNDSSMGDSGMSLVHAKLAYDCLNSIPFNQSAAAALMESMRPYLEWQTTTAYLKDPPKEYAEHVQPPHDFWAVFNIIGSNVAGDAYESEYDFGWELYLATQQAHDGHFTYTLDVIGKIFSFERAIPLVSVSENGKDLPVIYAYADILAAQAGNSSFQPSHIIQIDGVDVVEFLLDWAQYGTLQDNDALWNNLFYSPAQASLGGGGSAVGTFAGGGRGRFVYPGPTTTLTFANGTNVTNQNYARPFVSFKNVESGADLYRRYLTPKPGRPVDTLEMLEHHKEKRSATENDNSNIQYLHQDEPLLHHQRTGSIDAPGYPPPVIRQRRNMNGGYFLDEPGFEDVAVLTLASFVDEGSASVEFKKVNSDFIAAALAANKTKLIIDVSANGGGLLLQGYDLFKQLFPSIHPYGASRFRAHETVDWLGEIYSKFAQLNSTRARRFPMAPWDYHTDLDSDDRHFTSWRGENGKYGPHKHGNDTFTSLLRWDLQDPQIINYAGGIYVTGYGEAANKSYTQPFETHNVILVYDGYCASTCAIFSEFLRQEAGVKTISLGGRPSFHPMQGVGGVKGANMFPFSTIYSTVQTAKSLAEDMPKQNLSTTELEKYTPLALKRSIQAGVNSRDGIRRNDSSQTPWQFIYEPTECRIFYTKQMVLDQSAVWKTVADTVWGRGNACVVGNNSFYGGKDGQGAGVGGQEEENRVWDVSEGFDLESAWRGLSVRTEERGNPEGDCVMFS